MYSCCIFTTCPCCAHIDQAVGLCSHIVFCHFSPWAPLLSPPQPNTVQRGLVAASALSDAFITTNRKPGESSTRFLFGGNSGCFIPQEHNVENQIILQNVLHNTMPLFHREPLVSAKSHTHTLKTPVYTNVIIFFVVKQSVIPFPSRHHAYMKI